MLHLAADEVNENHWLRFRHAPADLRLYAVLAGSISGHIWSDDRTQPTWVIVQEAAFGTLYLAGQFPDGLLADLIDMRRKQGEVLYGFWAEDSTYLAQLPPTEYDGWVWESAHRAVVDLHPLMDALPVDCTIERLDHALFPLIQDYTFYSEMFGSPTRALANGFGYALLRDGVVVCEAFAGASSQGVIEIGVNTHADYRRRGYAALTCAHVIAEAERRGWRTYWNCAAQNAASVALAHKLGYGPMQQYRLWGWF